MEDKNKLFFDIFLLISIIKVILCHQVSLHLAMELPSLTRDDKPCQVDVLNHLPYITHKGKSEEKLRLGSVSKLQGVPMFQPIPTTWGHFLGHPITLTQY